MPPIRIVVSGASGRMGRLLGELAADASDLELLGGIAPAPGDGGRGRARAAASGATVANYPRVVPVDGAAGLLEAAEVVIDFSAPPQLSELLEAHGDRLHGRALVVGTTGLDEALTQRLDRLAQHAAVLVAANFSVGVNLLLRLAELAARALPDDGWDVEVVEAHHRHKVDAPSGTALALGRALAQGRAVALEDVRRDGRSGQAGERQAGEIGFHALRGGGVVGEHRVHFLGDTERLELSHSASDRAVFAEGALRAARWITGREAGRYSMADVLGL